MAATPLEAKIQTVAAVDPWKGKKYKLVRSINFDEYMDNLGVGRVLRKLGNTEFPEVELCQEDDTFTLNVTSKFKEHKLKFKLDEEFDMQTIDGRKMKCIITRTGDTFIQQEKGQKPTTIKREFMENQLITTFQIGEIKSVRLYETATAPGRQQLNTPSNSIQAPVVPSKPTLHLRSHQLNEQGQGDRMQLASSNAPQPSTSNSAPSATSTNAPSEPEKSVTEVKFPLSETTEKKDLEKLENVKPSAWKRFSRRLTRS